MCVCVCVKYRRLNAELEAKTSELVKEADQLLVSLLMLCFVRKWEVSK